MKTEKEEKAALEHFKNSLPDAGALAATTVLSIYRAFCERTDVAEGQEATLTLAAIQILIRTN